MIDWSAFDDAFRADDVCRAQEIVAAGEDGTPILGDKDFLKCTDCGRPQPDIPDLSVDISKMQCVDCADPHLQKTCKTHVGKQTPPFEHFSGGECEFCVYGIPVLNGVDDIARLEKVLQVYKEAREEAQRGHVLRDLESAIERGNEQKMAEIFESDQLTDWSKARKALQTAENARQVLEVLPRLRRLKRKRDYDGLIALWDENASLLSGRKSTEEYGSLVETWKQKNESAETILNVWDEAPNSRNDPKLAVVWERLGEQVADHPRIVPILSKINHRVRQQEAWAIYEEIPGAPSLDTDRRRADAWKSDLFEDDWPHAEGRFVEVSESKDRLQVYREIESKADPSDEGGPKRDGEQRIIRLSGKLPRGYLEEGLQLRIVQARERLDRLDRFEQVKTRNSELDIVMAWQELDAVGGVPMLSETDLERKDLGLERAPLVTLFDEIPAGMSKVERDVFLLRNWDDSILDECHDPIVERIRPLWRDAGNRKLLIRDLKLALGAEDVSDQEVLEITNNPLLVDWPFGDLEPLIKVARTRHGRFLEFLEAVDGKDQNVFYDRFDKEFFKKGREERRLRQCQQEIRELAISEIVPNSKNGLGAPFFGGLKCNDDGSIRVNWSWPVERFSETCLLCVCAGTSKPEENGEEVQVLYQQFVDRTVVEKGDGAQTLWPVEDWTGRYVAVRCVFDLGLFELRGEWLTLGQIE